MRPKKENKWKSTNFCLILYMETTDYDIETVLDTIRSFDDARYAYILHDCDAKPDGEIKKSHFHVCLHFDNARYNTALADEIGIPVNYIQRCRNWKAAVQYLIHQNNPEKYQYDPDNITANYPCSSDLSPDLGELEEAKALKKFIDDNCCTSLNQLMDFALSNNYYATLRRCQGLFSNIIRENKRFRDQELNGWYRDTSKQAYDRSDMDLRSPSLINLTQQEMDDIENASITTSQIKKQDKDLYRSRVENHKLHDGIMFDTDVH